MTAGGKRSFRPIFPPQMGQMGMPMNHNGMNNHGMGYQSAPAYSSNQGFQNNQSFQPNNGYHQPGQVDTPKSLTLEEMEREQILRVLDKHRGNKPAVAAELGISLKTLYNKLNRYAELGMAAVG